MAGSDAVFGVSVFAQGLANFLKAQREAKERASLERLRSIDTALKEKQYQDLMNPENAKRKEEAKDLEFREKKQKVEALNPIQIQKEQQQIRKSKKDLELDEYKVYQNAYDKFSERENKILDDISMASNKESVASPERKPLWSQKRMMLERNLIGIKRQKNEAESKLFFLSNPPPKDMPGHIQNIFKQMTTVTDQQELLKLGDQFEAGGGTKSPEAEKYFINLYERKMQEFKYLQSTTPQSQQDAE